MEGLHTAGVFGSHIVFNRVDEGVMTIAAADSLMAIFGFKRIASVAGNVITPVFEFQCPVCGDHHRSDAVSFTCENGDGYE